MWEDIAAEAAGKFAEGLGTSMGATPATSGANQRTESIFDSSGWNVIFGDGNKLSTERTQREGATTFDQYVPYVIAAAGVLIVWRLTKKR